MTAHETTLIHALGRFEKVKQRLSEIPNQLNQQSRTIQEKKQSFEDISVRIAEISACGYSSDPESELSERNAHHLTTEAKRLKASITAHKLEVDALQAEQAHLQVVQSQLLRKIQDEQRRLEREAGKVLKNSLDPSVLDKARDAFAECLYFVAVSEGSHPSTLDRTRVISRYLEQDWESALTKKADALYASRKQEALASVSQ